MSGLGTSSRRKPLTPKKAETKAEAAAAFARMLAADKAAKEATRAATAVQIAARQRRSEARQTTDMQKVLAAQAAGDQAATQTKLEHLYASRQAYRSGVTRIGKLVDTAVDTLVGEELAIKLNSAQQMLARAEKDLVHVDHQIESVLTAGELDAHIEECLDNDEYIQDIKQQITHLQVTYYSQNPHSTVRPRDIVVTNKIDEDRLMVKMPHLEVMTFSGDYREWAMFIDQFDSIIGNKRVDDVSKLNHLKRVLRGDAKASIFRLGTSVPANYQKARLILEERYGNQRLIARAYCHSLVTQPPVKANDGVGLRAFLTCINDSIEGLTQLGVDTTTWDCILVYHVLQKLDQETNRDYNMKHPGRGIPDLDELLAYLSDRAVANEDTAADKPVLSTHSEDKHKKKRAKGGNTNAMTGGAPGGSGSGSGTGSGTSKNAAANKYPGTKYPKTGKGPMKKEAEHQGSGQPPKPCAKCAGAHALYKCPEFDALSRAGRNDYCKTNQICFNCLRSGHGSKECKSKFVCNLCSGKHHTLLHKHEGGGSGPGAMNSNSLIENFVNPSEFSDLGAGLSATDDWTVTSTAQVSDIQVPAQKRAAAKSGPSGRLPDSDQTTPAVSSHDVIELPRHLTHAPLAAVGLGQSGEGRTALLGTVVLPFKNTMTRRQFKGRALLDNCSQINFVSKRFAKKMQLNVTPSKFTISTVGCTTPQSTSGVVSFTIPLPDGSEVPVHAYVFTQVTNNMPSCELDSARVHQLCRYDLADPEFYKPRAVDMLLGVEVYEELLIGNRVKDGSIALTETYFGYVVTGSMPVEASGLAAATLIDPFTCAFAAMNHPTGHSGRARQETAPSTTTVQEGSGRAPGGSGIQLQETPEGSRTPLLCNTISKKQDQSSKWDRIRAEMMAQESCDKWAIDDEIRKFWEINDIKDFSVLAKKPSQYTEEERFALKHFDETTTVDDEGFYVVKFPFIPHDGEGEPKVLGSSRHAAVRMLQTLHKKFQKDETGRFETQYREFVQELIDQEHVEEIDERDIFALPDSRKFYLPHHAVEKESTTTKLRVVMNASSKSSTKWSLNDLLAVGPKLQDDLICHLMRAGFHRIFLTGDVSKMYRTLKLQDEDMYFCLYLWQESPTSPIRCFRFVRVTYGIASSGHQAVYAMQNTANKHGVSPEVIAAINRDMYVDDFMGGADTREEAIKLLHGIVDTLWHNKLLMRKWASNDPTIIQSLDPKLKENVTAFDLKDPHHMVKMLGQAWNVMGDYFFFRVLHVEFTGEELSCLTKRQLLGDILKLFDPMGWLSPVTLKLKQFMQSTWAQGISWEEKLPEDIREGFLHWRRELIELRMIQKPRCLLAPGHTDVIQLHVFCDASEVGYAACIYARVVDTNGKTNVNLLFAKAKVAPVKQLSIPRLELLAATLGAKVLTIALQSLASLSLTVDQIFAYSDSTVVLAWLSKPSKTWATFVSNRVSEIQAQIRRPNWFHVKSEDNPADCASRGLYPLELVNCTLWWKGPCWLGAEFTIPDQSHLINQTTVEEKKTTQATSFVGNVLLNTNLDVATQSVTQEMCEKFQDLNGTSSFERTVRVTVHMFRFLAGFTRKAKVIQAFVEQTRTRPVAINPVCNVVTTRSKSGSAPKKHTPGGSGTVKSISGTVKPGSGRVKPIPVEFKQGTGLVVGGKKSKPVKSKKPFNYPHTGPPSAYSLMLIDTKKREIFCPTPGEANFVRSTFIKREQQQFFPKELTALAADLPCPKGSKLLPLYPFIDTNGVMKVGGRLSQSEELTDAEKFQIIIPKDGPLATLLVSHVHRALLHGTVQGCLAALRSQYWIIGAKNLIKKHVRECLSCFRFMCKSTPPLMGDLPRERITPSDPFDFTGVDFGGPFYIKASGKTGTEKAYIAMFVCFSSKAVHIELCGSLSAPSCIAAFIRFTNRRGLPKRMYSDNGTNFVGSRNELERLQKTLQRSGSGTLPVAVSAKGVVWVHIPPRSPNFGGLWESAIKSAKYHLKRIVGNQVLSREELETVLSSVEGVMNSRPLVEISNDECDFRVLTPAMLVMAKEVQHLPIAEVKEGDLPPIPDSEKNYAKLRWGHVNKMTANFWQRWTKDYLPTLQIRKKWQVEVPKFKAGDLVLMSEDNTKPLNWPLARISEVFPGNDGIPRVAQVKTVAGDVFTRPISKLRRLPMQTE